MDNLPKSKYQTQKKYILKYLQKRQQQQYECPICQKVLKATSKYQHKRSKSHMKKLVLLK